MNNTDNISESFEIFKFFDADPVRERTRIWDKYLGFATLA
jgi:hypothetical protein